MAAHAHTVLLLALSGGCVDDPADFVVLDHVQHIGTALGNTEQRLRLDSVFSQDGCGASGGVDGVAHFVELFRQGGDQLLVAIAYAEHNVAISREWISRRELGLEIGNTVVGVDPHDLAGGFHLGRQHDVGTGEADEGQHGFLHGAVAHSRLFREAEILQRVTGHDQSRKLCQRHSDGLADIGDGPGGARVDLEDVDRLVLDGVLHVHEADDVQPLGQGIGVAANRLEHMVGERVGRDDAGAVPGVHAGALHMLHDGADDRGLAVGDAIDVDFDGILEESVDEHGPVLAALDRLAHVAGQFGVVVDDGHPPSSKHERGSDKHGIADYLRCGDRLLHSGDRVVVRLADANAVGQLLEESPVLGRLDVLRRGANDVDAVGFQIQREVERSLSAELDDDAPAFLTVVDVEHILEGEGLEIELVAGVVVGGHGFRIAIDHDGLEASFAEREGGVDAAVVELDALADAVGASAEDHHLLAIGVAAFVDRSVAGVVVGCVGLELGGAGVDQSVHGQKSEFSTCGAHLVFGAFEQPGDLAVAVAKLLGLAEEREVGLHTLKIPGRADFIFVGGQFLQVAEKPGVDAGQLIELFDSPSAFQSGPHLEHTFAVGALQESGQFLVVQALEGLVAPVGAETEASGLQGPQRLLKGLLEGPADAHGLSDALHLGGERGVGAGELLECEARDFCDHVVDGGFEAGGCFASDVVLDFIERVSDGELGRELGDGESGCLGGEGAGARHTGVHLDDDQPSVVGIDGELYI